MKCGKDITTSETLNFKMGQNYTGKKLDSMQVFCKNGDNLEVKFSEKDTSGDDNGAAVLQWDPIAIMSDKDKAFI